MTLTCIRDLKPRMQADRGWPGRSWTASSWISRVKALPCTTLHFVQSPKQATETRVEEAPHTGHETQGFFGAMKEILAHSHVIELLQKS